MPVRYCRWCWRKGKVVIAVEVVDETPVCSDCFARLGVEEESVDRKTIDKVAEHYRGTGERGEISELVRRTGLSHYVVSKAVDAIKRERPATAPQIAVARVDPLAKVVEYTSVEMPRQVLREDPGIPPKQVNGNGEIRVDLLHELRKRRDALDHAIKALEIFEQ